MKDQIEHYFDRLWPICRSITGNGVRESLDILSEIIPLVKKEIPSGSEVFDWTVPKEWNVRDAYILTPEGNKIADFKKNNLHLVSYSIPVNQKITYSELTQHLHTLEDQPDAIPYVTSYYKERWGFCISHNEFLGLSKEGEFTVVVDSELSNGHLTYGELVLPGDTKEEIFFSTYICHPSIANNELSGPLALAFLYKKIASLPKRKYTYRFAFIPETIGAICYLSENGEIMKANTHAGFVLTCCGNNDIFHYKRSRRGNSITDKAVEHFLVQTQSDYSIRNFRPDGSDERQYCSPGFNLPVGSLMRTPYYEYQQYHTSLDNKSLMDFASLEGSVEAYFHIIQILELNGRFKNTVMNCEPQLGKRDLYPSSLSPADSREFIDIVLHLLNYSDGQHDLIDIANKQGIDVLKYAEPLKKCIEKGVLIAEK
jgi:aminopeptidase-like protein